MLALFRVAKRTKCELRYSCDRQAETIRIEENDRRPPMLRKVWVSCYDCAERYDRVARLARGEPKNPGSGPHTT